MIVTSSYPANPADYAGSFIPDFAGALVERGCTVTVLTPDKSLPKQPPSGYVVRWFPWAGGSKPLVDFRMSSPADMLKVVSLLRAGERELRALIAGGVDACLALWAVPSGFLAWRVRREVPYAVWALGSDVHTWAHKPGAGFLVRRVLVDALRRFADGLELSEEVCRLTGRQCDFLPSTRTLPEPAALPEPLPPGVNFLFVGRLEPVKGADVIVDAAIRLAKSGVAARLTMCGTGSLEGRLRDQVGRAHASDHVRLLGAQPADVVAGYMKACDCLVIPSRMESIPIVFSEGLQSGVPLLVTDVGDMGALARRYGLAHPVPASDADALAAAMEQFALRVDEHRASYGNARTELIKIFDVGATADRFLGSLDA